MKHSTDLKKRNWYGITNIIYKRDILLIFNSPVKDMCVPNVSLTDFNAGMANIKDRILSNCSKSSNAAFKTL